MFLLTSLVFTVCLTNFVSSAPSPAKQLQPESPSNGIRRSFIGFPWLGGGYGGSGGYSSVSSGGYSSVGTGGGFGSFFPWLFPFFGGGQGIGGGIKRRQDDFNEYYNPASLETLLTTSGDLINLGSEVFRSLVPSNVPNDRIFGGIGGFGGGIGEGGAFISQIPYLFSQYLCSAFNELRRIKIGLGESPVKELPLYALFCNGYGGGFGGGIGGGSTVVAASGEHSEQKEAVFKETPLGSQTAVVSSEQDDGELLFETEE